MTRCSLFFIIILVSSISYCQDSTIQSKNRLPYEKKVGLNLVYIDFTGYAVLVDANSDNSFLLSATPSFAHYVSKKIELILEYGISYLKYSKMSHRKSDVFSQFFAGVQYYPLKKLNFLFLRTGIQYSNYAIEKNSVNTIKEWNFAQQLGVGIEVLAKKKIVVHFFADALFPYKSTLRNDFLRSIGIGIMLGKN